MVYLTIRSGMGAVEHYSFSSVLSAANYILDEHVTDWELTDAENLTYLQALKDATPNYAKAEVTEFEETDASISEVVARRNWQIQFETGSAGFTPAALRTLDELYNLLSVNKLAVEIEGHTDSTGSPVTNEILSSARANAVREYLTQKNPTLFPANRVKAQGYGPEKPIAPNSTPDGRAQNRRVTVVIGNR